MRHFFCLFALLFGLASLGCDGDVNDVEREGEGGDLVAPDYIDEDAGDPITIDDAEGESAEPPGATSSVGEGNNVVDPVEGDAEVERSVEDEDVIDEEPVENLPEE